MPESTLMLAAVTPSSVIASEKQSVLGRLLVGLLGSLLLIACVAYLAGRSIVGALGRLADAAHSIAAGRLEERVEVRGRDEFAQLGRAFNEMAAQLEGRLEDLEAERRRLRDANARFGDALASSLDSEQLRRVIVESAVEATQAEGVSSSPRTARSSRPATSAQVESGSTSSSRAGAAASAASC